ncbi:hypothetical protein D3C83_54430 [compost metagenome]
MQDAGGDAPYARMLHAQRLEGEPGGQAHQRVRHQHGEQIALDLRVDLLEYAHRIFLA